MVNRSDPEAVFRALADPTRRGILALLRSKELSVQDIAEEFPMSRPAISKHLRILKEAELVEERREGRQRIYRLCSTPLAVVGAWLAPFSGGAMSGGSGRATALEGRPGVRIVGRPESIARDCSHQVAMLTAGVRAGAELARGSGGNRGLPPRRKLRYPDGPCSSRCRRGPWSGWKRRSASGSGSR